MKPDIATVVNPEEDEEGNVTDDRVQKAKEKAMDVMKQLETTRLLDVLNSTEIFWDPPGESGLETGVEEDDGMLAVYRAFNQIHRCGSTSPWVLRMKLDKEKMYRLGLTMMDVHMRIYSVYKQQVECLFGDDNANDLILRVRLTKEALKDVDPEDAVAALKAMEHNLVHNVLLKGMKGIKKVSMRLVNRDNYAVETDEFQKVTEWTLDTDGTNLIDILANPNIDPTRTRSNDIWEIYNTLGIEAARNALQREFNEVVGDDSLNYRHMSLLLDTMTNRGTLMSVDRHGINRGDVGPLAKCSFEETTDMLIKASIFSEHDKINGVSANIMLGQLPPCGTGDHEVLLDEEAYINLLKERNIKGPREASSSDAIDVSEPLRFDDSCSIDVLQMPYHVSDKPTKKMPTPKVVFA
jgi:DNA-directed RNA polymerase II subunit RPB1